MATPAWSENVLQADLSLLCHPDISRPFSSKQDAFNRLAPFHLLADDAETDTANAATVAELESRAAIVREAQQKAAALRKRIETEGDPARLRTTAEECLLENLHIRQEKVIRWKYIPIRKTPV